MVRFFLKVVKTRQKNVGIEKKTKGYDSANLHYKMFENVWGIRISHEVYQKSDGKPENETNSRRTNRIKIQRGIFKGDSLPQQQFVLAMIPLNFISIKC